MRTVLLVVAVVSLPLFAADEDALGRAIRLFKSPDPAGRTAGSSLAEKEVRRLLAPLVEAMKDPDPEVRRRAREAVLSIVPEVRRAEPQQPRNLNQALALQFAARAQQRFFVQPQRQERAIILQPPQFKAVWQAAPRGVDRLRIAALGVRGTFVNRLGVRTFRIDVVERDSVAKKAGFAVGDFVLGLDGRPVRQKGHMQRKKGWSGAAFQLLRGNRIVMVKIP